MAREKPDEIQQAYGHLLSALRSARDGYRTIRVLPDEELDSAQRLEKHLVIEEHAAFVRDMLETVDRLMSRHLGRHSPPQADA